jgi:hypothetical protein
MDSVKSDLILSIDVGSSSVKCSAFEVRNRRKSNQQQKSNGPKHIEQCTKGLTQEEQMPYITASIASASRDFCAVKPITGKIMINDNNDALGLNLFIIVDHCIDDVLKILEDKTHVEGTGKFDYNILGCGIASFVMNLIGVDDDGLPLGNEATFSYACNDDTVNMEAENLKR